MARIAWALLGALCALLLSRAPLVAQGQPSGAPPPSAEALTLEEYGALLNEAAALLEDEPNSAGLRAARRLLEDATQVRLAAGDVVQVAPLLTGVRSPQLAQGKLAAATAQLAAAAGDRLAERQALFAAILARREFAGGESLLDRLWRWLRDLIERFLPKRSGSAAQQSAVDALGSTLANILLVMAGAALVLGLGYWLSRMLRSMVGGREPARRSAAGGDPTTAAEARTLAHSQAQSGSYREAVRSLYLSALLTLEEARLVPSDRTFTNRELLARMREDSAAGMPSLRATLAPVIDTFEPIWYGVHEPDSATFAAYRDTVDALTEGIAAHPRSNESAQPAPNGPAHGGRP